MARSDGLGHTELRVYLVVLVASLLLSGLGALAHGVPTPVIHDEFTYLFAGETFAKFRLTNPSPPSPESFFSPHVLVEPSYSSKYPPAQGLFLAFGQLLGLPILGIWLSGALAAVALLWCSRALLPMPLALVPTVAFMVTVLFASRWVAGYMGGLVPFIGGALVLGFFLRLHSAALGSGVLVALGAGLAILSLSRPFEGVILLLVVSVVYGDLLLARWRSTPLTALLKWAVPGGVVFGSALLFQTALNSAVTGSAVRMPHVEFHRQYMEVPLFRLQAARTPEKPNARLRLVEHSFRTAESWYGHLAFTIGAAVGAVFHLSGWLLPGFIVLGGLLALRVERRLVLAVLLVPVFQSSAHYVHLAHYYAPIAPAWFLFLGIAAAFAVERYARSAASVLITVAVFALTSTLPAWVSGAADPRPGRYHQIMDLLPQGTSFLVFVRYAAELSPHVNVVYNDPDLRNSVILANFLDAEANCRVTRAMPTRQVVMATVGPKDIVIEPTDLALSCRMNDSHDE